MEFCSQLAFHLSRAFKNNCTNKFDCLWCDGILPPDKWRQELDTFHKTKEILTMGFVGTDGQDKHWIMLKLGSRSFKKCMKGLNLEQCLPGDETLDWIEINPINKIISLQLL